MPKQHEAGRRARRKHRHCEERSDEAIQSQTKEELDCFAALAMTAEGTTATILRTAHFDTSHHRQGIVANHWPASAKRASAVNVCSSSQLSLRPLCNACAPRRKNCPSAEKSCCGGGPKNLFAVLPNFARACGRVSVGRYPDKRPDSRQGAKKPRVIRQSLRRDIAGGQHLSPGMP